MSKKTRPDSACVTIPTSTIASIPPGLVVVTVMLTVTELLVTDRHPRIKSIASVTETNFMVM